MALIAEDDYFNTRLNEINDEMQKLLDRTARQHDDLQRPSFMSSPPALAATSLETAKNAAPPSLTALGPLERAFVEQEMRQLCREEMTRWMMTEFPKLVTHAVEREVEKRLADVLRTTEKMHAIQSANAEAVARLQKEWRDAQRELAQTSRQSEGHHQHLEATLRADMERYVKDWRTDMDVIKDTVSGVERSAQQFERRAEKRVDELAKNHLGMVQEKLASVESTVESWKSQLYELMRHEVASWRSQRVELDTQVARCEGAQRSQIETMARHTASLSALLEGSVEQKAEVRRCRRDVNRLEMLVQCAGVSEAGAIAMSRAGREGSEKATVPPVAVVQELFMVKERISFLAGRLEAMDHRLHNVDQLLVASHSHPAGAAYAARGSLSQRRDGGEASLGDAYLHAANGITWDGSPANSPFRGAEKVYRSAAGGDVRDGSVLASAQRQRHDEQLARGGRGGDRADHVRAHPQTADADKPMPTSVANPRMAQADVSARRGQVLDAYERPATQRRPPPVVLPASSGSDLEEEEDNGRSHLSESGARPLQGSRFASPLLAGSHNSSQRPGSRVSGALSTSQTPAGANEPLLRAPPRAASASVTPHDSYISASTSRRGSPVPSQGAASPGQYTPAPGSDTESDISNQKLSRIALD